MRIGIAGLHYETDPFSRLRTRRGDFRITRDSDVFRHPVWGELQEAGHELYPVPVARRSFPVRLSEGAAGPTMPVRQESSARV